MNEGSEENAPSNAAEYFGGEVKALREALGLSQTEFAKELKYTQAQVSKVETGQVLASETFAEAMDAVAKTPGVYARLRARLSKQGHPEWFVPYINLEEAASGITDYSCTFLMGLLQTPEYATAVFRAAHPRASAETIKESVDTRLLRRVVMERQDPPLLWVVIHEAVLRAEIGGRAVMAAQLEHLIVQSESPHVTLQVLPFKAGAAPSHLPFTLLSKGGNPSTVYTETPTHGGQVDDSESVVGNAVAMLDRLRAVSASEADSRVLMRTIMEEHSR
ncbi:MAG TPA: helix-turn-helix transcriptional regulator [Streptomyces sp.]